MAEIVITKKHFVKYEFPLNTVNPDPDFEIDERNPSKQAADAPEDAYGFWYYDQEEAVVEFESGPETVHGRQLESTGTYYINAEVFDFDEAVRHYPDSVDLLDFSGLTAGRVLRLRTSGFQYFHEGMSTLVNIS